jgi:hypothetical protein
LPRCPAVSGRRPLTSHVLTLTGCALAGVLLALPAVADDEDDVRIWRSALRRASENDWLSTATSRWLTRERCAWGHGYDAVDGLGGVERVERRESAPVEFDVDKEGGPGMTRMKLIVATVGVLATASLSGMQSAPSAPTRLRIVSAVPESPVSGECGAPVKVGGAHAYYEALASRAECVAAFSLRRASDLRLLQGAFGNGAWDYRYPDPDYTDGPDAARLTWGGSLVGRNQLILGHQVNEGRYVWVIDVLWSPEMQANIKPENKKANINHKMLNIRDGGGIYFEPGHVYQQDMAEGEVGVHKVRLYSGGLGVAHPAGFIRDAPMTPPGQGATVAWPNDDQAFRTVEKKWHRFIVEVDLDQPGTSFTEWAQEYNSGQPISTWDIVSSKPGDGAGTTKIRVAQEHQLYFAERAKRTDMSRVTISGHSDTRLNGTWLAKPDPEDRTLFTIPVAGSGNGSGGRASMHYHRLSWWVLDENRDAVRVLYRVPWLIRSNLETGKDWRTVDGRGIITRWDVELNTSSSFQDHAAGWYMTTPPTIEPKTVITTPEPHGYRVGDRLAFRFSDVIPPQTDAKNAIFRVMEVVSPTKVRLDWPVTRESVPDVSGPGAGTYGYVAKVFRAYWRNWVLLKNIDLIEADRTIFARPLR